MKYFLISLFCLYVTQFCTLAQTIAFDEGKTTRAVVIGISDYQDPGIPDLQYADKDAEAFVAYLQSPSGGNLSDDNIKLLTNEKATSGQMGAELMWLVDESKEGDLAIIYFSGHGDVESKLLSEPGYLLCWDSPSKSYGTGAFSVDHFKSYIQTLSIKNKAKVIVITDACRAGNLAGKDNGGTMITNESLSRQIENEIKILSCQPDEFSIEGEQWGGGIFSHHLIEGLYGFADENADELVNLKEIERYLEDKVSTEAEPHEQTPMTIGNIKEIVSNVDLEILAALRKNENPMIQPFSGIDQKGFVEDLLATLDSNIVEIYHSFLVAVDNKEFFEPMATCADTLYKQLVEMDEFAPIHNQLRRNYAAALQDDAQQMLNRMVFQPEIEREIWFSPQRVRDEYGPYPRMLDRAAELLGEEHYMYPILKGRKAFFEGGIIYLQKIYWKDKITGAEAIEKFRESLAWQPNAPHTFLWMGMTFEYNLTQRDSADYYIYKAFELAPTWTLPLSWKADYTSFTKGFAEANEVIEKMASIDSTDENYYRALGTIYTYTGKFGKSNEFLDSIIAIDSTYLVAKTDKILNYGLMGEKKEAVELFNAIVKEDSTSGYLYYFMGNMYYYVREYENAIPYFKTALELDPSMIWAYSHYGDVLIEQKRYEEAETILIQGYERDSTYMPLLNALGGVYAGKNELEKANYFYSTAIELDDSNLFPFYNLAMVQSKLNNFTEALANLEIFLQKGGTHYFDHIQSNTDLDGMREMPEFIGLMKKYFPTKFQD